MAGKDMDLAAGALAGRCRGARNQRAGESLLSPIGATNCHPCGLFVALGYRKDTGGSATKTAGRPETRDEATTARLILRRAATATKFRGKEIGVGQAFDIPG